ncbi:hypothetical protein JHK87_055513 [Glycine soja]|nr:hypothetical protein JHK87_055513 [Glycine soja]
MANITSKELESYEEVNLNDVETLQSTYHELLSNSSMLSKAYQTRENISKTSQLDLMGSVIGIDLNRLVKLVGPKTSHLDYLSLLFDWKCIQNEINWFTSVNFYGTDVPQVHTTDHLDI